MKIEFYTSELSEEDKAVLRALLPEMIQQEEAIRLAALVDSLRRENTKLAERVAEFEKMRVQPVYTRTGKRSGLRDEIEGMFQQIPDLMLTVRELTKKLNHDNEASVYSCLHELYKRGVLDKTMYYPKKFFLKARGNPELREMVPKGTKVSRLG